LHSDLLIFIHQGVFLPLDHVDFPQKSWIKKGLNGVGTEKKLYAKKWYKKELV
jgi:hypothetical protein